MRAQGYKAFYIAIGCQGGRKAGIPGEDAQGVMTAVDFLRTVGGNPDYPVEGFFRRSLTSSQMAAPRSDFSTISSSFTRERMPWVRGP